MIFIHGVIHKFYGYFFRALLIRSFHIGITLPATSVVNPKLFDVTRNRPVSLGHLIENGQSSQRCKFPCLSFLMLYFSVPPNE